MIETTPTQAKPAPSSRLAELVSKYGSTPKTESSVESAFQRSNYTQAKAKLERVSQHPQSGQTIPSAVEVVKEQAAVDLAYADMVEKFGKLRTDFFSSLNKKGIFDVPEWIKYTGYNLIGRKEAARQLKVEAIGNKHQNLENILNGVTEVANEIYQNRIKAEDLGRRLQLRNVSHIKKLYKDLVDHMKEARYTVSDQAAAESEVKKFESELKEIDGVLIEYEDKVMEARNRGDIDSVKALTDEMTQVIEMRDGVMNGQLAAEDANLEIRRQIIDASEGVKVSKEAIVASEVSYQTINALIEAAVKHKIMYKHFLDKMVEVMQIQGQVSTQGREALKANDALVNMYEAMALHLEANSKLAMRLTAEASTLLYADKMDTEKAKSLRSMLKGYLEETRRNDMEWAQKQQTMRDMITDVKATYVTNK